MDALLVLNNKNVKNCRVMVHLKKKEFIERIIALLENGRGRETFDILLKEAEVKAYLPDEASPPRTPMLLVLHEDLL